MIHRFDALQIHSDLQHAFLERVPGISVDTDRDEAIHRLRPAHDAALAQLGFAPGSLRLAEQVHGAGVAAVDESSHEVTPSVDGLITATRGIALGIYVADCAAIFLVDRQQRALGLVHSGKKGSELGIVGAAIDRLKADFGVQPGDLIIQVSPCIRPPHYEVDFARQIEAVCVEKGVIPNHYHDDRTCTASHLDRYYSYRTEKGKTGRMLAVLGWPK